LTPNKKNFKSFYDWEREINPKLGKKSKHKIVRPFTVILPSWQIKKNYSLLRINSTEIKLYDHEKLKTFIKRLLEIYQYTNPHRINDDLIEISNELYQNKGSFKELMDRKLEVY